MFDENLSKLITDCSARIEKLPQHDPKKRRVDELSHWRETGVFPTFTFTAFSQIIQFYFTSLDQSVAPSTADLAKCNRHFVDLIVALVLDLESTNIGSARCFCAQVISRPASGTRSSSPTSQSLTVESNAPAASAERSVKSRDVVANSANQRMNEDNILYLSEVILNCLEYARTINECEAAELQSALERIQLSQQLKNVAKYYAKHDASLVIYSIVDPKAKTPTYKSIEALNSVYQTLSVGSYAHFDLFKKHLPALVANLSETAPLRIKMREFCKAIKNRTSFAPDDINELAEIYADYWLKTDVDYSQKSKQNSQWLHIARCLAGANLIPPNYYRFLMPTSIVDDTDSMLRIPIQYVPLSSLLILDTGKIANLEASIYYYEGKKEEFLKKTPLNISKKALDAQTDHFFLNCSVWPHIPFTDDEVRRISSQHRFSPYVECIKRAKSLVQAPLKLSTLDLFYDLLNATLQESVLQESLDGAYITFWAKLKRLSAEERDLLYSHRIQWDGSNTSIYYVLRQISLGDIQEACISAWGKKLAKFTLDHFPSWRFKSSVERYIMGEQMRANSLRKTVIDDSTPEEIILRNQKLMVTLLAHSVVADGDIISYHGCNNTVDPCLRDIFNQLKQSVEPGSPKRDLYRDILAFPTEALPDTAKSWFDLIRSEHFSLFDIYDPADIFMALQPVIAANTDLRARQPGFFHDLVDILLQPKINAHQRVCINVKLHQFLQSLDNPAARSECLMKLAHAKEPINQEAFFRTFLSFISQFAMTPESLGHTFFASKSSPRKSQAPVMGSVDLTSMQGVVKLIRQREVDVDPQDRSPLAEYIKDNDIQSNRCHPPQSRC